MYTNVDVYNQMLISGGVPYPCQNGREKTMAPAVTHGQPELPPRSLAPCAKRICKHGITPISLIRLSDPLHCRT